LLLIVSPFKNFPINNIYFFRSVGEYLARKEIVHV